MCGGACACREYISYQDLGIGLLFPFFVALMLVALVVDCVWVVIALTLLVSYLLVSSSVSCFFPCHV